MNKEESQGSLWHTVLIDFNDGVSSDTQKEIYDRYQTLAEACGGKQAGILFWKVDYNIDTNKRCDLTEIAIFQNDEALKNFKNHPAHVEMKKRMQEVATWKVGDIYAPLPYTAE